MHSFDYTLPVLLLSLSQHLDLHLNDTARSKVGENIDASTFGVTLVTRAQLWAKSREPRKR